MRIALHGSTGIIGSKVLQVVKAHQNQCSVVALTAGTNIDKLLQQAREFAVPYVMAAETEALHSALAHAPDLNATQLKDTDDLCSLIASDQVDMLVCAASGISGLKPVLTALQHRKKVALASKEILVLAGNIIKEAEQHAGGKLILPVDSEHCAIFQCLEHHPHRHLKRIILTASGGPFRNFTPQQLETMTPAQALNHPVWKMGQKITIDSATLMNKALELIEAHWLFSMPEPNIDVVVHPQVIIHSMVEFIDASIIAQMGCPDMTLPIQFCLFHPERQPALTPSLDFTQTLTLTFEPPDTQKFPALNLARHVLRHPDRPLGAVFNAANEIAVSAFLEGRLSFTGISRLVERTLERCQVPRDTSLSAILEADALARACALEAIRQL